MMYDQTRAQQSAGRTPGPAGRRSPGPEPLLSSIERDKVVRRLRHALNTFADTPREALEEAESAYDEATAQLVNALAERRRLLRADWQDQDSETQSDELRHALNTFADTPFEALEEAESAYDEATAQLVNALAERRRLLRAGWQDQNPDAQCDDLRHALRQYREITQRLLHI